MLYIVKSEFESSIFYGSWAKGCKKLWALSISFSLFLWKRFSATPVIRWHACKLLWNLNRKQGNLAIKYFESKALLKIGIDFYRSTKRMNVLRLWDARRRFIMLEELLLDLMTRKPLGDELKCFKRWRIWNKFVY